jgi:hypothetical protein
VIDLAEYSKESYGSERAVLPMMIIINLKRGRHGENSDKNVQTIYSPKWIKMFISNSGPLLLIQIYLFSDFYDKSENKFVLSFHGLRKYHNENVNFNNRSIA